MALCPKCGKEVGEGSTFCPHCGGRLGVGVTPDNTSGQGESAIVPEQVKGWNWGAFSLTWIWGIFSQVWIAFLVFIPFPLFGLAWAIVLGVKGNEWAWRNKKWHSIEHFKSTQRPWNIAGIVLFAISMVALIVVIPLVLIPMFLFW